MQQSSEDGLVTDANIYLDEIFDEVRLDRDFLVAGWSFVRSTILLFRITYTEVPVLIPSSKASRAARRKARSVSSASRECELTRRLIDYLQLPRSEISCGALPEL